MLSKDVSRFDGSMKKLLWPQLSFFFCLRQQWSCLSCLSNCFVTLTFESSEKSSKWGKFLYHSQHRVNDAWSGNWILIIILWNIFTTFWALTFSLTIVIDLHRRWLFGFTVVACCKLLRWTKLWTKLIIWVER